ncbi:hypothetical protein HYU11_01790 [Candidatus Woesearchaeota archaeon]|nr:hypothetical protein [Candidatus Woesearchaeota archaeon]
MSHCCGEKHEESQESEKHETHHKKDKAGLKEYALIGLLFALIIFASITAIKINALTGGNTDVQDNGGGETYDEMMARMHPEQAAAKNNNNMVGGC